ncbi:MAG: two-component regulator propeller domain-containing protein [Marinifilaceae bacterium]
MKNNLLFLTLFFASFSLFGQLGVGNWQEHLPFRKSVKLLEAGNRLFCLTESGLFSYSFEDNRVLTYSKINGLSDVGIQTLEYDNVTGRLLIGYQNGNVDLLEENQLVNIPDIRKANLSGNSSIYSVLFHGNKAFLGTGFGIVVLNLDKSEVADTYYIGDGGAPLKVNGLTRAGKYLYAATGRGIYRAEMEGLNLADFNNWDLLTNLPDFQGEFRFVLSHENQVFVVHSLGLTNDQILVFRNGMWNAFVADLPKVSSVRFQDNQLWVVAGGELRILNLLGQEVERIKQVGNEVLDLRDALQTQQGNRYLADFGRAVLGLEGDQYVSIKPDGPQYTETEAMLHGANSLWMLRGGRNGDNSGKNYPAEISLLEDRQWRNIDRKQIPQLNPVKDLVSLAINPVKPSQMYLGSWGQGILVMDQEKLIEQWDAGNSPLGNSEARIAGMAADRQGALWVLDAGTSSSIKVRNTDGQWIALEYSPLANQEDVRKIIVTSDGDKWVLTGPGMALFAVNENQTLANRDDDVYRNFRVLDENKQKLTSTVFDLVEDKEGSIWLGTDRGVMVYSQPGNLLRNKDFYAYRPVINLDGTNQYLLGTEKVHCIAVDGANQKWLGTENSGVFLVSSSGDEQLLHFHTGNSPLLSNRVHKISIDPQSGEVFFATDKGLISYKGAVTEGGENFSKLYVYPNPVRETYHGDIVVSGLMTDSSVKITDVSGNLVYEGQSQGGQMLWDGRNFSGSRVHTGVYLIFCANSDGSKSKVIKLLLIH